MPDIDNGEHRSVSEGGGKGKNENESGSEGVTTARVDELGGKSVSGSKSEAAPR